MERTETHENREFFLPFDMIFPACFVLFLGGGGVTGPLVISLSHFSCISLFLYTLLNIIMGLQCAATCSSHYIIDKVMSV